MPVLPHASLSQFRPSCGSGSGLRGVLPGAASWSKGTRRCTGDGPTLTLMQGYIPADFILDEGPGSLMPFEKLAGYTEMSSRSDTHIVARQWLADLGITPSPAAIVADDYGDVPVLLVPIPTGQTSADMPLAQDASLVTPVVGRFVLDVSYSVEFGIDTYLLGVTGATESEVSLANVCITRKVPMYIDCPGVGGYWEDGLTTPANVWCFGPESRVEQGVNVFKRILPDEYHLDFQAVQRVSDSSFWPLFPSVGASAAGTHVATTATLYTNNPAVGTVVGLGDTACP